MIVRLHTNLVIKILIEIVQREKSQLKSIVKTIDQNTAGFFFLLDFFYFAILICFVFKIRCQSYK